MYSVTKGEPYRRYDMDLYVIIVNITQRFLNVGVQFIKFIYNASIM
jgi:hypothetical protein